MAEDLDTEFDKWVRENEASIAGKKEDWNVVGRFIYEKLRNLRGIIDTKVSGNSGLSLDESRIIVSLIDNYTRFMQSHSYSISNEKRLQELKKIKYEKNKIRVEVFPSNPIYKLIIGFGLGLFSTSSVWLSVIFDAQYPIGHYWPFIISYILAFVFIIIGLGLWSRQEKVRQDIYYSSFGLMRPAKRLKAIKERELEKDED